VDYLGASEPLRQRDVFNATIVHDGQGRLADVLPFAEAAGTTVFISLKGLLLRIAALVLIALLGIAANSVPAQAMSLGSIPQAGPPPALVEVDRRCGRHYHYIRGYRSRHGYWVRGHCVRNHRY
jgi:hypothetical protein